MRLGEEDLPIRYMRSGRVGFFCRVLRPGQVRAGDRIELTRRESDGITVAELARVLLRDEPDAVELDRILSSSVLPELVRAKLAARVAARERSWTGDRPLVISARAAQGAEVAAFELAGPAGERLPDFQAGQFITLALDIPGVQQPVVRTYTLAGRSADGLGYRIAIKREPAPRGSVDVPPGLASGYLHDNVVCGTTISARASRGRFVLQPGGRPVVLVSAGIGITPMLAMFEELARTEIDPAGRDAGVSAGREVFFVHGARSSREVAFGQHVRDLVATSPRFHGHLLFSRPQAAR